MCSTSRTNWGIHPVATMENGKGHILLYPSDGAMVAFDISTVLGTGSGIEEVIKLESDPYLLETFAAERPFLLEHYEKPRRSGVTCVPLEEVRGGNATMIFEAWDDGAVYQTIFSSRAFEPQGGHEVGKEERVVWSPDVERLAKARLEETFSEDYNDISKGKQRAADVSLVYDELFGVEWSAEKMGVSMEEEGRTGEELLQALKAEGTVFTGGEVLALYKQKKASFGREDIFPFLPIPSSIDDIKSAQGSLQSVAGELGWESSLTTSAAPYLPNPDEGSFIETLGPTHFDEDEELLANSIRELCNDVMLSRTSFVPLLNKEDNAPVESSMGGRMELPDIHYQFFNPSVTSTPAAKLIMSSWPVGGNPQVWKYHDPYVDERVRSAAEAKKPIKMPKEVALGLKIPELPTFGSASQISKTTYSQPVSDGSGGLWKPTSLVDGSWKPTFEEQSQSQGPFKPSLSYGANAFSQPVGPIHAFSQSQNESQVGPFSQPEGKPPPRKKRKAGF
ncbi:hypothetical protein BT69DRAFT_750351 [Atractiella rhizophila]|nr:hypothetical protein BT69DRAFT_750351 [Atractiella rhizophila]